MTKHEFLNIMRRLMVEARRAELLGKIQDACGAAGFEDVGEFINSLWENEKHTPFNAPTVNEYDFPMGPIMKEIYDSGYTFWDCTNPQTLISFIDPYNGHWSKNFSELVGGQKNTWGIIYRKYKENKAAGTLQGPKGKPSLRSVPQETLGVSQTIDDALDNSIRSSVNKYRSDNETG